ncbi:MAG TPA: hypothetical protein PKW80_11210 [Bacteroidales bacterium]|nr:hypothetical protein [Bacteroidales bacterium]
MLQRFFVIISLIVIFPCITLSQKNDVRLDSLKVYTGIIASETADFSKYAANERLQGLLEKIFMSEKPFDFPYDSVPKYSALTAPDKKFKILTWGIAKENGSYEYFGYILFPDNTTFKKRYIKLFDNTDKIVYPENEINDFSKWYGAIYYKVILSVYHGKRNYTLLGWKGNNELTTKKVIEVLSFRTNGTPVFGKQFFRKYKDKEKIVRVIFEYSSRSAMLLRYDEQMIHEIIRPAKTVKSKYKSKDKKSNKALSPDKKVEAKTRTTRANMIVFDRLSPLDPRTSKYAADLEGQYQFYVPESNVFDAFIFEDGKWRFIKDVDARNPKPQNKKKFAPPQL